MVEAEPGGKVLVGAGEAMFNGSKGVATLGSFWLGTLGRPGDGMQAWLVGCGPRSRHDSKRSCRLAMASTWVMVLGGGASLNLKAMDDFVCWSRSRDGAVGMTEFDRVRGDLALGITLD
jgi:hypothetical protein